MSKDMAYYERTFAWLQFAEGKARFAGGIRGWDERGHDTFAVDLEGDVLYGEIDMVFLPNGNDYYLKVVTFGYGVQESIGILNDGSPGPQAQGTFGPKHLQRVQSLVVQLVRAGLSFEKRPVVLRETSKSHFIGKVLFPDGWAVGANAKEVTA